MPPGQPSVQLLPPETKPVPCGIGQVRPWGPPEWECHWLVEIHCDSESGTYLFSLPPWLKRGRLDNPHGAFQCHNQCRPLCAYLCTVMQGKLPQDFFPFDSQGN